MSSLSRRLLLLRFVAGCFQSSADLDYFKSEDPSEDGMHCLGAVSAGQVSPNGTSNNSSTTTSTSNTTSSSNNISNSNNVSNNSSSSCSSTTTTSSSTSTSSTIISSNGSNNSSSSSSSVVGSVVRALGVLVCEGRIQGPPRGYKEGPHCVPPLQPQPPNNHECEKDNYLCDRYLVLVREITERVSVGAYLCVEVVLCSDCPCGLIKSKSKHRVLSGLPPLTSWQHSSEMLLEYWRIGVVPSKSPETMNCQGLYQAVRSRLHFSQVAAWWSRTNGARPSYIATRIVPQPGLPDDHLRRFREPPVEHTFPLAALGDGNSVKVSVWALPRMEDIPQLQCPMHPLEHGPESELARPDTPIKRLIPTGGGPVIPTNPGQDANNTTSLGPATTTTTTTISTSTNNHNNGSGNNNPNNPNNNNNNINNSIQQQQQQQQQHPPTFVYYMSSFRSASVPASQQQQKEQQQGPALLDDRLQIDCDKPGKHHCRCADEEDEEPSPPPVSAATAARPNGERKRRRSLPCRPPEPPSPFEPPLPAAQAHSAASSAAPGLPALQEAIPAVVISSQLPTPPPSASPPAQAATLPESGALDGLERRFRTQLSIDELQQQGHLEKRYKRSESDQQQQQPAQSANNHTHVPSSLKPPSSRLAKQQQQHHSRVVNVVVNPMCGGGGGGGDGGDEQLQQHPKKVVTSGSRELNHLMSKLSLSSQEKETSGNSKTEQPQQPQQQQQQQPQQTASGILDWISRVPGRVLGAEQQQSPAAAAPTKCEVKMRNNSCNLELSPREFDEVLAVLRARTPLCRKRSALRTAKRRDKYDRLLNETQQQQQQQASNSRPNQQQQQQKSTESSSGGGLYGSVSRSKAADALLGAILRSSSKESSRDEVITEVTRGWTTPNKKSDEQETPGSGDYSSTASPESSSSGLESALNKRFSRLKQLFKRPEQQDQQRLATPEDGSGGRASRHTKNSIPADSKVKRRIDFSTDLEDNGDDEEDDDDDDDEEDDEEEDDDDDEDEADQVSVNGTSSQCDSSASVASSSSSSSSSSVGTSTNSAHSIFHSTNSEKRSTGSGGSRQYLTVDKTPLPLSKMSRGKRYLLPIRLNNNNHINSKFVVDGESPVKPDGGSAEESESGTEVEQDGAEANDKTAVPSAKDQARFRRSLENAASMVFHSRTGLPLTSSPAPLRRGSCCFDFDSSLNSVSSKRSALFELNTPPSPGAVSLEECDREAESAGDTEEVIKRRPSSRHRPQSHALLGSFEESALNGRLEPVSTVHGFAAEIGASGSFCPKHRKLPVTVFFYTLGDNDKVSSPYLAHINLGKKPYQVPRMGTIQVTLLNPLGTVVKMFVVLYDLTDMPPRSHTFLRQRTLRDKTLRYLIHLRFMSGKTGRIYLHTDVRMIICRKADVDTASDFGSEPPKELRSYTHGPTNPKFSPRC